MDKIKVYYNKEADTVDIWFGNPDDEFVSEEAGEGVILKKNKDGIVIGVEKLYVSKLLDPHKPSSVEVLVS
ncbi:MAG: DUF2283 domain-containing protein [Nitrospirota bacterium]